MSAILRTARDVAASAGASIAHIANRLFPPKQRERALENIRTFSVRNPKLAVFLAAQTALAGLPILLFLAFAVSTLAVSLITCIFLGVVAAFAFTLFITGLALLFVVPVVFIGSCTASIVFLWGLVGYLVLQQINGGETPVKPGTKVGNTLDGLTGGRLHGLVDRADSNLQQGRLAVDSSRDEKDPTAQYEQDGPNPRSSPARRRYHGQTNGFGHSGEAGKESQKSGAACTQIGTRNISQGERDHPEADLTTYDPEVERVVDWKTEFQREGIAA